MIRSCLIWVGEGGRQKGSLALSRNIPLEPLSPPPHLKNVENNFFRLKYVSDDLKSNETNFFFNLSFTLTILTHCAWVDLVFQNPSERGRVLGSAHGKSFNKI